MNQLGNIFDFSKLLRAKSREEKAALEGINKAIGSLLTGIEPIIDIWLKIEKERRDEEIKKIYT